MDSSSQVFTLEGVLAASVAAGGVLSTAGGVGLASEGLLLVGARKLAMVDCWMEVPPRPGRRVLPLAIVVVFVVVISPPIRARSLEVTALLSPWVSTVSLVARAGTVGAGLGWIRTVFAGGAVGWLFLLYGK